MGEVEHTNLRLSFKQRGDRHYDVTAAIDGGSATTSTCTIAMSDEALQEAGKIRMHDVIANPMGELDVAGEQQRVSAPLSPDVTPPRLVA